MRHAQRMYAALSGLMLVAPSAFAQPAGDSASGVIPAPGVLGLLAIGGVAAAAAIWRNRHK